MVLGKRNKDTDLTKEETRTMKEHFTTLYLSYYHTYLRVSTFAEAHGMTEGRARRVIRVGKQLMDRKEQRVWR